MVTMNEPPLLDLRANVNFRLKNQNTQMYCLISSTYLRVQTWNGFKECTTGVATFSTMKPIRSFFLPIKVSTEVFENISIFLFHFQHFCPHEILSKIVSFSFQSQNPMEDPFVPTSEDLAGFWDMVYLQVQHVNSLFADLYELRRNNWTPKVFKSF